MRALIAACLCLAMVLMARGGWAGAGPTVSDGAITSPENPASLSVFGLFDGGADRPVASLIPYRLGTPLFSDYAEKERFLYLPKGSAPTLDANGKLQFPVGTALIKSFGYPDASGKLKIIETRLLLNRPTGWVALPYVWRADGRDADLKLGGTRLPMAFHKPDGRAMDISYAVPNKNQCKQCHSSNGDIAPIGPVWSNIEFLRAADQRRFIALLGPQKREAVWNDVKSGTVEQRALAYLRVNCGHCHKPTGAASNSGLFFADHEASGAALGIGKRPVAAGRGSGDNDFVIDPGHPERSILIYRLRSTDPGIAMPELGRATAHDEGLALLEQWIRDMKP
jgi:uncharacterized repeat protein (TIGR03806 family)